METLTRLFLIVAAALCVVACVHGINETCHVAMECHVGRECCERPSLSGAGRCRPILKEGEVCYLLATHPFPGSGGCTCPFGLFCDPTNPHDPQHGVGVCKPDPLVLPG